MSHQSTHQASHFLFCLLLPPNTCDHNRPLLLGFLCCFLLLRASSSSGWFCIQVWLCAAVRFLSHPLHFTVPSRKFECYACIRTNLLLKRHVCFAGCILNHSDTFFRPPFGGATQTCGSVATHSFGQSGFVLFVCFFPVICINITIGGWFVPHLEFM